jgi:hypothetical protein
MSLASLTVLKCNSLYVRDFERNKMKVINSMELSFLEKLVVAHLVNIYSNAT